MTSQPVVGAHLHARGVAAVPNRGRSGARDRAARPPEPHRKASVASRRHEEMRAAIVRGAVTVARDCRSHRGPEPASPARRGWPRRCGAARRGSSPSLLEVLHRARHRLAARADHLRDRLVRERLLDRVAAALRREVEQQPRDAAGDVEQHEPADLLVGAAQAARQLGEQRPRDARDWPRRGGGNPRGGGRAAASPPSR